MLHNTFQICMAARIVPLMMNLFSCDCIKIKIDYCVVKNFGGKKVWQIGTQNSFGGENLCRFSIYTEGNQVKQKSWQIKL